MLANDKFIEAAQGFHLVNGTEKDAEKFRVPPDTKKCGIVIVDPFGDELAMGRIYDPDAPENLALAIISKALKIYDSEISWLDSVEKGIAKAKKRDKPVLVFMADDKKPSQQTLQALNSRELMRLRKYFVFVKIAHDKESEDAKKWSASSAPYIVILNPFEESGKDPMKKISGQKNGKTLQKTLEEAKKAYDQIKEKRAKTEQVFALNSSSFEDGEMIPNRHFKGENSPSPNMSWPETEGAKSYAIICANSETIDNLAWITWVIFNIPEKTNALPENISKGAEPNEVKGAKQGVNNLGSTGYAGLIATSGRGSQECYFTLYALDTILELKAGIKAAELLKAMEGHIIKQSTLVGLYKNN
ncbi:MAG: YbhB/YbcL family Raf kinase inhibitor-like protein [Planctomycetes bacterium]|nr:YbhB/YbcL family Raf kinase inhibitor-like protein [Planctomycetota bacterium]